MSNFGGVTICITNQPTPQSSHPPRLKAPSTAPRNVAASRGEEVVAVTVVAVSRAKRQRDLVGFEIYTPWN